MRADALVFASVLASLLAACGSASSGARATGAAGATATGGASASGEGPGGATGAGASGGSTPATGPGGGTPSSCPSGAAGVGGDPNADPTTGPTFIAFASSFDGFPKWTSFPLGNVAPTTNEMDGPRTIFINKLPPKCSTEFPVGTIIVKRIEIGGPTTWQTFAMVKRGGGFNALGANGWEWFEITVADDLTADVAWRGVAPPSTAGYGGGTKGGICNTCHMGFDTNDYVQDAFLQLPSL